MSKFELSKVSVKLLEEASIDDFAYMDWQSPIHMMQEEIAQKVANDLDNQVYQATMKVGIKVDKDELVKALEYDRNQYQRGYMDGFFNAKKEITNVCIKSFIDEFMDELYNLIADADDVNPVDWWEVEEIVNRLRKKYTESEEIV